MPIHNITASTVNLAKSWLMTIDRQPIDTQVPTATLVLWLETLIALGEPMHHQGIGDAAARKVMGHAVAVSEAQRAGG